MELLGQCSSWSFKRLSNQQEALGPLDQRTHDGLELVIRRGEDRVGHQVDGRVEVLPEGQRDGRNADLAGGKRLDGNSARGIGRRRSEP